MLAALLSWKHRLGYAWHQFVKRHTYWLVVRPDRTAGFVSFGDRRAVTHFARYYLGVGDEAVIRRRWYVGKLSTARMRALAGRYGLAVAADQLAPTPVRAETLPWPSLVELVIDLPTMVEEYRGSLPWSSKSDLNRIRQHGLSRKVSRDKDRLMEFYHRYFLPSMTGRHAANAYVLSVEDFMQFFSGERDCELIEAWCDGVWVGGIVCETDEVGVRSRRVGWLDGDATHYRKGVAGALHWFAIVRAIERRKQRFIFGGVAPYLEDGLFHAKTKWRAHLSCELSNYAVWRVMIDRSHRDCQSFFERYSLLMKHEPTNQFCVLSGRTQDEVKQATSQASQLHEWRVLNESQDGGQVDA